MLTNHTASAFSYLTRGNKLVRLKLKARQVECIHLWRSVLYSSFTNANLLVSTFRTIHLNDNEYQSQAGSHTLDHIFTDAASTPTLAFGLFYPGHGWLFYDWAETSTHNIATIEFFSTRYRIQFRFILKPNIASFSSMDRQHERRGLVRWANKNRRQFLY